MPKPTPVNSEVIRANSRTGMEGEALMGMAPKPENEGNVKWRIRRVPANATSRPEGLN
jgi:hypothetical protein